MTTSLYFYIRFFLFQNLHSVQRNFMASKSFKVGFSMNIKMMLFPQFVSCFILTFLSCQPFVCSFISDILQCQILSLLLQNCKVKHSRPHSFFLFCPPVFFIGKFSAANSTKLCSALAKKSRKEAGGNPYWMLLTRGLTSNSTRPANVNKVKLLS